MPAPRWARWVDNFRTRHGATGLQVADGALTGSAADGSVFTARLPFLEVYDGPPAAEELARWVEQPADWGVLLVRKGGFAVARLAGDRLVDSKVGRRHVQGRTKAGGQSQRRFARRREKQAREAYEAAAGHAVRLLGDLIGPLVAGGDHAGVDAVLADRRLAALQVMPPWLSVPDPRRDVLERGIRDAAAIRVEVTNADDRIG